jgi:Fe-S-cluster containining protein
MAKLPSVEYSQSPSGVTSRILCMKLPRSHLNALATTTYEVAVAALKDPRGAEASATLCRRLNGVIDGEIATLQAAGAGIACAAGCSFCCHLRVGVFPHEAVALLQQLRTRVSPALAATIEQRVLANAQRVDAMTPQQHRTAGLACAFLVEGRCSAHDARPAACAAYHSLSRERCEHSFQHPAGIGTAKNARPALLELQVLGTALIEATQAAYKDAGVPGEQVELHQALRGLLAGAEPG